MSEENLICHDTYLRCLAMFVMANDLYVQLRRIQLLLDKTLGVDDGSHIDDAIYCDSRQRAADFDEALSRQGIIVAPAEVEA